eukprot:PLAT2959.1.p1 GENE.PLAT2959.1~~PLAT2959.1.p1  ORF type:complete len:254 (+),score=89.02 PLAT2959.1:49-762(+)
MGVSRSGSLETSLLPPESHVPAEPTQGAKLAVEFMGTLFLVLTVKLSEMPLAIGSVLMVMIFAGGHISGAHYNPAVTLGVTLRGGMKMQEMLLYWLVQLAGGLAGGFLGNALGATSGTHGSPQLGMNINAGQGLLAEFLYTFALVTVVLNVATTKSNADNSFYGLAIGFTVFAGAASAGPVSGGVFNPAVGLGTVVSAVSIGLPGDAVWIYFLAPLLAGAFAAAFFRFVNAREYKKA